MKRPVANMYEPVPTPSETRIEVAAQTTLEEPRWNLTWAVIVLKHGVKSVNGSPDSNESMPARARNAMRLAGGLPRRTKWKPR
jgi:hypothetical protein